MKKDLLLLVAVLAVAVLSLTLVAAKGNVAAAPLSVSKAASTLDASSDQQYHRWAEPLSPAQIAVLDYAPPGAEIVKPDPSKLGRTGLVQALKFDETKTSEPAVIQWFDNQDQALATLQGTAPNAIILGILYENSPAGGDNMVIWGDNCNNIGVSNLYPEFDNGTSHVDNSCPSVTLYANSNYGGAQQTYGNGSSWVGSVMNDQASSVLFKP